MEITEVRIKLMEEAGERLQAFCSITFDDSFVVRDLKIIEGTNGPFVAMPSRKLTAHCPQCGYKNHLRAGYCNQCGTRMSMDRTVKDEDGRAKLYADIAHPINSACREMIQERVIREFHLELERSKLPGYVSRYDDFDHEDTLAHVAAQPMTHRIPAPPRPAPQPAAVPAAAATPAAAPVPAPERVSTVRQVESAEAPKGPHTSAPRPANAPNVNKRDSFGAGVF